MFTKYPGKLFLMGEFAIMEKGSLSVVSAVDHFLNIELSEDKDYSIISSHGKLKGDEVFTNKIMPHVHASLKVLNDLIDFKPFKMVITSELEVNGNKVGFGSSGVVIVGVLDSLLRFHNVTLSKIQLFKLACLVQLEMDEFSSGGDLAASIYRDTIIYQSYDREWLKDQEMTTENLINIDWPLLNIEVLETQDVFDLSIGWTGSPNATSVSVDTIYHKAHDEPAWFKHWIDEANKLTRNFISAVKQKDFEGLNASVKAYRKHMLDLQTWSSLKIETASLTNLIESTDYPSKISGSGGGDCGIVFVPSGKQEDFIKQWEQHNITNIAGGTYHEY